MERKQIFLILIGVLYASIANSQSITISGKVIDKSNGETLLGCNVYVENESVTIGAVTNEYGFYSMTIPKGTYNLYVSYIGYNAQKIEVNATENKTLNFQMEPDIALDEVVIVLKRDTKVNSVAIGLEKLDISEIEKLPVLFGEKDVLKTIQLIPGVKSSGEGGSGFSVRGGGFDQNLILLDEAPVYNASHLLGFFSTFNSDAIKNATLIKGNAPAQYGGRLSSVLDVIMKDGNNQEYEVSGGIGLISSRLNVEGPIQKGKSSFLVSGRRTYADLFLKVSEDFKDNSIYFYDLNLKANYEINDNNKLFLSGYFGRDNLGIGTDFGVNWGNGTGTLRWNSILSQRLFLNTSLIYSNYTYDVNINTGSDVEFGSEIEDFNLKQDYQFFQNERSKIKFGFNSIYHTITPSEVTGDNINQDTSAKGPRYSWDNAVYLSREHKITKSITFDYGLRFTTFTILGDGLYNFYDGDEVTGSVTLDKGEFGKTYYNLEPRFLSNFRLNQNTSLKAAYSRNTQNLHLLSNSTSGRPTDQWIGSTYNVKPEISDQVSLGYFKNFKEGTFEFGAETYFKWLQNQVDYKNGANINTAPDIESELLYGEGRAYGLELTLKKTKGKFTGWFGYTLSKTERLIEGINNDEWYNARQDQTHNLSLVGTYELNPRWTFSALFVYNTGNAVTFPSGKYEVDGNTVFYYNGRNKDRMPDYHRLDLSATLNLKPKGNYTSSLNFSLYNAYGRENAYLIDFEDDPNDPSRTRAVQTALFKFVPSVTYNFKF